MHAEKLRQAGELAAWHLAGVALLMPFVNAKLNPQAINPYGKPPAPNKKLEEVKAFIADMAIRSVVEEAMRNARRE